MCVYMRIFKHHMAIRHSISFALVIRHWLVNLRGTRVMQNPTRCPLWVLALVKNLPFTVLETMQSREIDHRSRGLIRDYFVRNICPKLIVGLIIKTHHCFGETVNHPQERSKNRVMESRPHPGFIWKYGKECVMRMAANGRDRGGRGTRLGSELGRGRWKALPTWSPSKWTSA